MSITLKNSTQSMVDSGTNITLSSAASKGDIVVIVTADRAGITTPVGYTLLHTEAIVAATYDQTVSVMYKAITSDGTESVTITQASSTRLYGIMFVIGGALSVTYTGTMNRTYFSSGTLNRTITKPTAAAACIWYVSCNFGVAGVGNEYVATPNDMTRQQSPAYATANDTVRLAGWFDDGTGAQTHTLTYPAATTSRDYIIDGVVIEPKPAATTKYLIEDNSQLYTVSGGSLVSIIGTLSASLFENAGFDSLTNIGALLQTLSHPTVHAWSAAAQPDISSDVTALPYPQSIIASTIVTDAIGMDEINATYAGNPLVAIKIDSGGWEKYDSGNNAWVSAGTDSGNTIAELQAISAAVWETKMTGAGTFKARITLSAATDTISELQFVFLTN